MLVAVVAEDVVAEETTEAVVHASRVVSGASACGSHIADGVAISTGDVGPAVDRRT